LSARLWAGPAGFGALLFTTGVGVLAAPGLKAGDQASLAVALLAPLASLARAAVRAAADAVATGPAAWQALADATRGQVALGLLSLVFLAPAGYVLSRVLARSGRRAGYRG
jgi:hypothetical protein